MQEAIRLYKNEEYSLSCAAREINDVKTRVVPAMTLFDRLKRKNFLKRPVLGRRQVPIFVYFMYRYWCPLQ